MLYREGDPPVPQWAGYMYMAQAIVDPDSAWESLTALNIFDSGNSKTNALYWAATRPRHTKAYIATGFAEVAAAAAADVPQSCLLNSACFAQGLTENCCPTESGVMLGCCPSVAATTSEALKAAACSANPRCVAQGLGGSGAVGEAELCCPTLSGVFLSCCGDGSSDTTPAAPAAEDPDDPSLCANNAGCSGLEGACCPTAEGSYLGCCAASASSSSGKHSKGSSSKKQPAAAAAAAVNGTAGGSSKSGSAAACSNYEACSGLIGDCCPTAAGDMLGCCSA
jgi:hypothetical protein